jgi:eukaryotic-like serine/threonine-protein kinase
MSQGTTNPRVVAGRYEFEEVIGRGGMGLVWRARDRLLERFVAVKEVVVPPAVPEEERRAAQSRVLREARAAARLGHPGVVTVFDVLEEDGQTYIVMELMQAMSLDDLVSRDGPLDPTEAARVGLNILDVLEAAHRSGIVHRDIKPANVMVLRDHQVKLADFGIASMTDDPRITTTGVVFGSPAYMAPEQAKGEPTGPPTDLWGLGATLYYAVEARPPFDRGQAISTLAAVVSEEPHPPRHAGPLAAVIRGLMEKDPRSRLSGPELTRLLEEVADRRQATGMAAVPGRSETEVLPEPETMTLADLWTTEEETASERGPQRPVWEGDPAQGPEERRRKWLPIAAGVGLMAALLLVALLLFRSGGDGETPAARSERTAAPTTPSPSPSPSPRASPSPSPSPRPSPSPSPSPPSPSPAGQGVPRGWTTYTEPDIGYRVAYPSDWNVVDEGDAITDFEDPDSGTYLRIQYTPADGTSPQTKWENFSQDFAARHDNYEEIGITPTTFLGYEASMWEFTYSIGDVDLHAADLGFEAGAHDFALFFQTGSDRWDETRDLHEALLDSFRV